MSFFDELIGWVNYVLFSPKPLVNLQQFVHLLLKTFEQQEDEQSRSRKDEKTIHQIPPQGVILLSGSHWLAVFPAKQEAGVIFLYWLIKSFVCLSCLKDVRNTSIMARWGGWVLKRVSQSSTSCETRGRKQQLPVYTNSTCSLSQTNTCNAADWRHSISNPFFDWVTHSLFLHKAQWDCERVFRKRWQ